MGVVGQLLRFVSIPGGGRSPRLGWMKVSCAQCGSGGQCSDHPAGERGSPATDQASDVSGLEGWMTEIELLEDLEIESAMFNMIVLKV